jgi:hypothetical protein
LIINNLDVIFKPNRGLNNLFGVKIGILKNLKDSKLNHKYLSLQFWGQNADLSIKKEQKTTLSD